MQKKINTLITPPFRAWLSLGHFGSVAVCRIRLRDLDQ